MMKRQRGCIFMKHGVVLYNALHVSPKVHRYGLCVTRGSHSFTCHPHTNTPAFTPVSQGVHALWLVIIAPACG